MAGIKSDLKNIWGEGKDLYGKATNTIKAANPVKMLPAMWNGTPYDRTPGYSLGINDKLTGYNPSASISAPISAGVGARIGKSVAQTGLEATADPFADYQFGYDSSVLGAGTYAGGGGGGGGGGAAAAAAALAEIRAKQQEFGDREKGLITGRRDAFVDDTDRAYQDQLAWLESQAGSAKGSAESGRENIGVQRDQSIASTERTAEGEARDTRDIYQDLIVENRRRTRATGAGSSSAFLELSNNLDTQLQRGLTQIGDTKVEKVGVANSIAQQAVGELDRTLQNVLAQIDQNKAISLREKDKALTDARMNADEALLAVDKWLAETFFSLDQMEASARSGGGGGGSSASFDKQNYASAVDQERGNALDKLNQDMFVLEQQGKLTSEAKQALFNNYLPTFANLGYKTSDFNNLSGTYMGNVPNSEITLWQSQNPGVPIEEYWNKKNQYNGFNFGNTNNTGGNNNFVN